MASKSVKQTKTWVEQWKDHVREFYEDDVDLIGQVANLTDHRAVNGECFSIAGPIERAAEEMVQGGCFLVYYGDVDDFAKENPGLIDRRLNDENRWERYKANVARAVKNIFYSSFLTDEQVARALDVATFKSDLFVDNSGRLWAKLCEPTELVLRAAERFRGTGRYLDAGLFAKITNDGKLISESPTGDKFVLLPNEIGEAYKALIAEKEAKHNEV